MNSEVNIVKSPPLQKISATSVPGKNQLVFSVTVAREKNTAQRLNPGRPRCLLSMLSFSCLASFSCQ